MFSSDFWVKISCKRKENPRKCRQLQSYGCISSGKETLQKKVNHVKELAWYYKLTKSCENVKQEVENFARSPFWSHYWKFIGREDILSPARTDLFLVFLDVNESTKMRSWLHRTQNFSPNFVTRICTVVTTSHKKLHHLQFLTSRYEQKTNVS